MRLLAVCAYLALRDTPLSPMPPPLLPTLLPQIAAFVRQHLYDASTSQLRRAYTNAVSSVPGFADDYACQTAGCFARGWLFRAAFRETVQCHGTAAANDATVAPTATRFNPATTLHLCRHGQRAA